MPAQTIHHRRSVGTVDLKHGAELFIEKRLDRELIALHSDLLGPNLEITPVSCDRINRDQINIDRDATAARKRHFTECRQKAAIGAVMVGEHLIALV